MATVSYQGPLPFPTGLFVRSGSFGPFRCAEPKFLEGAVAPFLYDSVLPAGTVGVSYNQTLTGGGGSAPYTFAVVSGVLPAGLSLNSATGVISGTPTSVSTFPFHVSITDTSPVTGTQLLSIAITTPAAPANYGYTA